VHVQGALRRPLDEAAHLTLDAPVALGVDEPHIPVAGVRMQAHAHQRRAGGTRRCTVLGQLSGGCAGVPLRGRAQLDLGQERLVVGTPLGQLDRRQDPVGDVRKLQRGRVDEQQLLLDSHAERLTGPEGVATPPHLRRRGMDLGVFAHGVSPSAARAAIRPKTSAAARPLA
jgi:hypothetical protein